MRVLLSLCLLVASAIACPTGSDCGCCCDKKSYPPIVPSSWNVRTFDSQYATIAFQGVWYLQMAPPTQIKGLTPLFTGLFYTQFPCCNMRLLFQDTTPGVPYDFNTDYYMIDSSFNLATQRIETTRTVFKSAYGPKSSLALFNVGTQKYYNSPIKTLVDLIDDGLIRHPLDDDYQRDYTVAMIGGDEEWSKYIVFAVINKYDNIFTGNDNNIVWMLSRDVNPGPEVYQKAFDDIRRSGLNPNFLMSIDQSINLSDIPTVTEDDLNGVIQTTSTTSSSTSKSISTTDSDIQISSSSTSTSTSSTTTIVSTVEITLNPNFKIPYEFGTHDLFGDIQILKNLSPETIREALSGKYYVQMATPFVHDTSDEAKPGLFHTSFPTNSLQILFDKSVSSPWDYTQPTMMLDRAYNMITGKLHQTRSMITSSFDGSTPWNVYTVYTEGYSPSPIPELSPLSLDGMIPKSPGDLYKQQYIASILGYQPEKYLLFYIANKYKNMFFDNNPVNQLYVITRDRVLPQDIIDTINQDILRSGYKLNDLSSIDQTQDITDDFTFDSTYFQYSSSTTVTTSTTSSTSSTSSTLSSLLSPLLLDSDSGIPLSESSIPRSVIPQISNPIDPIPSLNLPDTPNLYGPVSGLPQIPSSTVPRSGIPQIPDPSFISPGILDNMPGLTDLSPGLLDKMPDITDIGSNLLDNMPDITDLTPDLPDVPDLGDLCPDPKLPCIPSSNLPGSPSINVPVSGLSGLSPNGLNPKIPQLPRSIAPISGLPKIVPSSWNVKTFDSQLATKAFQGPWYLQLNTPIRMNGLTPTTTGLFNNLLPCSNIRLIFRDTTPDVSYDFNTDYYMIDSSFNLVTQRIETKKTLFKSAYGPQSTYAIFNVITEEYFTSPLKELEDLVDDTLIRHTLDDTYKREYTLAIVGADDLWNEYLIMTVVNKYDNIFTGNDGNIVWMLSRKSNPDWSTYKKAYDDLKKSGINSRYLMSMDQSINLSDIPTITKDDLEGVVQTTSVTTSSTSKSISSDSDSTSISTSSTSTTTTISSVEFTLKPDFKIPYEFGTHDLFGNIQILKNLSPEVIREALSGKYYVQMATPFMNQDSDDIRPGLLHTAFPTSSLQVLFDNSVSTPWDYTQPTMMLDRAYNMITGELKQTRSMITSSFDGSTPWNVFTVYTEGYSPNPFTELSPLGLNGMIAKSPGDLYKQQYIASVVGYLKDKYLIFTIANKYKNLLYGKDSVNQMYVYTRDRFIPQDLIDTIDQEILRSGYFPYYLSSIDQTMDILDDFEFDNTYFEYTSTTTVTSSSSVSVDGVTVESSSHSSTSSSRSVSVSSDDCGC